jgi:hypothetical protein
VDSRWSRVKRKRQDGIIRANPELVYPGGARLSGVHEKLISSESALAAEVNLLKNNYLSG